MLIEKIIEFIFSSLWITFLVVCVSGVVIEFWFKKKKEYVKEIELNTKNMMGPFCSVTDEITSYNGKKNLKPLKQKEGEWINCFYGEDDQVANCSVCGGVVHGIQKVNEDGVILSNFLEFPKICPHCHSKMRDIS